MTLTPALSQGRRRLLALLAMAAFSATAEPRVVDLPTRPGVTQRFLYVSPGRPLAAAILFAGSDGTVRIAPDGRLGRGGNFLVRSRAHFVAQGIAVAVIDHPSDQPSMFAFRGSADHARDIREVIAWLRRETGAPVWLIGTSRGTQSAASIATKLSREDGGADGVVLTSSVLSVTRDPDPIVTAQPLERITVPVLVVHHRQDGCAACPFDAAPSILRQATSSPRKELLAIEGGVSRGDPCEAFAYHGYNGIEAEVVGKIARWMLEPASAR